MVIYETQGNRIKAYSDRDVMIHGGYPEADYVFATDPANAGRTYTETDIPIENDPTVEEKASAFDILTGEET